MMQRLVPGARIYSTAEKLAEKADESAPDVQEYAYR